MYDSRGEAEYAARLDLLVRAGEVVWWERPAEIPVDDECGSCGARFGDPCVTPNGTPMLTFHKPRLKYKPDFWVVPREGSSYYVDYKGLDRKTKKPITTPMFNRKMIQWRKNAPWELRISYKPVGSKAGDLAFEEKVICTGEEARMTKFAAKRRRTDVASVPRVR